MPKIAYINKRFHGTSGWVINRANEILTEYAAQGYRLTLRQLYYQFVARGLIQNKDSEYNRLGNIVADARLTGHIDWDMIEDRGRWLRALPHWRDPAGVIDSAAKGYHTDKWAEQPVRVEVWIEKDALVGVIEAVCSDNDVGFFACRGYTSATAMWEASVHRFRRYIEARQRVYILHFGDHDPSGLDMTRDIEERSRLFLYTHLGDRAYSMFRVERLALTMEQVRQYNPPPNPAKLTDSRARDYVADYGYESWELDALEPQVINDLIQSRIEEIREPEAWIEATEKEEEERSLLLKVSERWEEVRRMVEHGPS